MSCPGTTNHYPAPTFYHSMLLTLLSLSSPFLTNNLLFVSFSPLPHTAYKHLARRKALSLKPFQTFLKCGFVAIGACAKKVR